MAYDVFISYSSKDNGKDKSVADAVCAKFEEQKIRCWIAPRDIIPGATWTKSIVEAIGCCKLMILIFSGNANQSPQVMREVQLAFEKGMAVVPFRIEDIKPSDDLKYYIGPVHYLDALTPPMEMHIQEMASKVKIILGKEPTPEIPSGQAKPRGGLTMPPKKTVWITAFIGALALALSAFAWWFLEDTEEQYNQGERYYDAKNYTQAERWFRRAAIRGNAAAQNYLGFMHEKGQGGLSPDDEKAVKWYKKAAKKGNSYAQNNLGRMYQEGQGGLPQDDVKAVEWYQKAAEQEHVWAQNNLGFMYEEGRGVPQDDKKAVEWYQKAAGQEHAMAQNNLGLMYEEGRGVPQDDKKAVEWYQKAAEQENDYAQNNLGFMYKEGRGVPQNDQKENDAQAVELFQKAVAQENDYAQYNLGLMYAEGRGGLPQDDAKAVEWFQKAAKQGHKDAQKELKKRGKSW